MSPEIVDQYGDKVASTTLEVKVSDATGKYMLPDDAILREKKILDWFVLGNPSDDAVSPSGRPLVSPAVLQSSYITLKVINDDQVSAYPLIQRVVTADDRGLSRFESCPLSPSKSFIEMGNTALATVGESYVLVFLYLND